MFEFDSRLSVPLLQRPPRGRGRGGGGVRTPVSERHHRNAGHDQDDRALLEVSGCSVFLLAACLFLGIMMLLSLPACLSLIRH